MKDVQTVLLICESMQRSAEYNLEEFKTSLEKNPAYAFEWGSTALQAANDLAVVKMITQYLTEETDQFPAERLYANVVRWAREKVMREGRFPSRSTSVLSNESARCQAAAWAEVLDKLGELYQ